MSLIKNIRHSFLLITGILIVQGFAQNGNLVVSDTVITSEADFAAGNSITAGPGLTVASTGDATFTTNGTVYFSSGTVVVQGGKLQVISDSSIVSSVEPELVKLPTSISVKQNYPNPFNPTTTINYSLPKSEDVSIVIYNALGQGIKNLVSQNQQAGNHSVMWNAVNESGSKVSNGIYYYRVNIGNFSTIKKMILLK